MSEANDDKQNKEEKAASDELKDGLRSLFSAARKVIKSAEPHVQRSLDDVERVLGQVGKHGDAAAHAVSKEVAGFATRVAEKLREAAKTERKDLPEERVPPEDPKV